MVCGNDTNRITYVTERFFHSFKLFDSVEMSERQTKTKGGKNYEQEREKKFTDWKHIPYAGIKRKNRIGIGGAGFGIS